MFLINGQPTRFIKTFSGIRQGDPLSSYLFILVSQNFTLLNYALRLDIIPCFNPTLPHNFNHLMYGDDLVLITKAPRDVARNVRVCLSIYSKITSQNPNHNKSSVFFPKKFNQKVAKSISRILAFTIGSYPLTYLGIAISPNKLPVSLFAPLVSRFQRLTSFWMHQHISYASRVILINHVLLTIPSYTLAVYSLLDSILD